MAIYTHGGDSGETDLYPWGRIRKTDVRMEAIGTLDELNASLGVVRSFVKSDEIDQKLERFLQVIIRAESEISCLTPENVEWLERVGPEETAFLEAEIDRLERELPELHGMLYCKNCPVAAFAQLTRTICRRAERAIWRLKENHPDVPVSDEITHWLNRFSDYLFMLGRKLQAMENQS
ncbi:MAG: cob(I)yrinic acid a,c-diamide adenosyltransferase [Thermoguttaceae bacterium]|nr:cob(I)yrinic acid a,c-diamide adenosyltransferase [Thermoguttaceae bacterium]